MTVLLVASAAISMAGCFATGCALSLAERMNPRPRWLLPGLYVAALVLIVGSLVVSHAVADVLASAYPHHAAVGSLV